MDLVGDKAVSQIVSRLRQAEQGPVQVEGTWGSFARLLTAHLARALHRPILHVCPHIDDADRAFDDLKTFGAAGVELLPAWEGEEDLADATDETRAERLRIVSLLADRNGGAYRDLVIAAPIQALCQPIPKPSALRESSLELKRNEDLDPEAVVEWLVQNSFERVDAIDLPGQFARRGGIIDIYAPLASEKVGTAASNPQSAIRNPQSEALRIEFFGDTIESIREINLDTQRSTHEIESITIVAAASDAVVEQRELFTNILPDGALVVFEEPAEVEEVANVFLARLEKAGRLYAWPEIFRSVARFPQLHLYRFAPGQDVGWASAQADNAGESEQEQHGLKPILHLDVKSIQQFERKATSLWAGHKAALEELIQRTKEGSKVFFFCESPAEVQRVTEIVKEIGGDLPHNFQLPLGYVHQGFVVESLNLIVVSHHELFGQYALRRRERPARATAPVDSLADLQPGEYVVHVSYGIGKFLGIETIEERTPSTTVDALWDRVEGVPPSNRGQACPERSERDTRDTQGRGVPNAKICVGEPRDALATKGKAEYLTIEYADNVKIHVAVQNIALVQKYIGTSPKRPTLSKVGSKRWQKQKEKVAESVRDLAAELLDVQAKRQAIGGITYGEDSNWQMEFEESFPYQETPDQIGAIREIKADMQEPIAMDRLLCGDVGYGKT